MPCSQYENLKLGVDKDVGSCTFIYTYFMYIFLFHRKPKFEGHFAMPSSLPLSDPDDGTAMRINRIMKFLKSVEQDENASVSTGSLYNSNIKSCDSISISSDHTYTPQVSSVSSIKGSGKIVFRSTELRGLIKTYQTSLMISRQKWCPSKWNWRKNYELSKP